MPELAETTASPVPIAAAPAEFIPPKQVADRRRGNPMPNLQQFAANANAAPSRVLSSHRQDQLSDARSEPGSSDASSPAERCRLPPHQLSVPTQHRFRLDQPTQCWTRYQAVEGSHHDPIGGGQPGPIDLPPQNPDLMAQEQQLRFRLIASQAHVDHVKQEAKA
jgi:hypothetical protein